MGLFKPRHNDAKRELRKSRRLNDSLDVSLDIPGAPAKIICFCKDISEDGISLYLHRPITVGTVLRIWIHLPNFSDSIDAFGKVVWIKEMRFAGHPFLIGIKFTIMDPSNHDKLVNYVSSLPKNGK
jgi:Tfp pilus assembly protein PilZ